MLRRVAVIVEIAAFIVFVVLAVRWAWTQDSWFEPYTVLCGLVTGGLELCRRLFSKEESVKPEVLSPPVAEPISDQERNERYARRKELLQAMRNRLRREKNNIDQLASDPRSAEGDKYTEIYPFELIRDDVRPLTTYDDLEPLASAIIRECERALALPCGGRSVATLFPLLRDLDTVLSRSLHESKVWPDDVRDEAGKH